MLRLVITIFAQTATAAHEPNSAMMNDELLRTSDIVTATYVKNVAPAKKMMPKVAKRIRSRRLYTRMGLDWRRRKRNGACKRSEIQQARQWLRGMVDARRARTGARSRIGARAIADGTGYQRRCLQTYRRKCQRTHGVSLA